MNRLVAAWSTGTEAPSDVYAFAYDQAGERVLKYRMADGQVQEATYFLRDEAGNVLTELLWAPTSPGASEGAWTRMKDYVYHGRVPIVRVEPGGSARHYVTLVTDHLGSTRSEVFDASSIDPWYQSIDLWPYGEIVDHPGATLEKHLFTAHEREFVGDTSGVCSLEDMDYMHARYYSPHSGRFLSLDSFRGSVGLSQVWNRYTYVQSNPVSFVDPSGEILIFAGVQEAKDLAEAAANSGLFGKRMHIDEDGNTEFVETDEIGPPTREQAAMSKYLENIDNDPGVAKINLVLNSDSGVFGGTEETIAMNAVSAFNSGLPGPNKTSVFIHEVYEKFLLQAKGYNIWAAHDEAIAAEQQVCGFSRMDLGGSPTKDGLNYYLKYSNNSMNVYVTLMIRQNRIKKILRGINHMVPELRGD
jgi:RHS repeat-associated protein